MQKKEIARFLLLVQMSLIIYQESPFPEKRPFSYFFTNTDQSTTYTVDPKYILAI